MTLHYDPLGRLWEVDGAKEYRQFLYDGDALVAEYDQWGNMLKRYVHGQGADTPQVWFEGAGTSAAVRRYLFTNHHGSVTAIADGNGNTIKINRYDEYGIPGTGNIGRFQYTGQAWLEDLGMYHYKARIYSPTLGRFLQTDPIGYEDQINLYAYVGNDPVNMNDPTGMSCTTYTQGGAEVNEAVDTCESGGESEILVEAPQEKANNDDRGMAVGSIEGGRIPQITSVSSKPDYCFSTLHRRGSIFEDVGGYVGLAGLGVAGVAAVAGAPIVGAALTVAAFGGAISALGNVEQALAGDESAAARGVFNAASGGVFSSLAKGNDLAEALLSEGAGSLFGNFADSGC